jgi:ERF superfamily
MSTEFQETRSLHRKLATIMWEAERIPKNGIAPAVMGGYRFVQVGDAADYIRKALAEKVITMMPTSVRVINQTDRPTKAGGIMTTVDLMVDWTLTDGESGESIVIQSFGAGADGGDKYSGKASTSAMKYALLSGFLLSTGEDTEGDAPEARQPVTTAPVRVTQAPASAPSAPATRPGIPAAVAAQREEEPPFSGEFKFPKEQHLSPTITEPPLPPEPAFTPQQIIPPAPHGGWIEGQLHTPGHKPLRARQNGSLFCPSKMPDGGWCPFKTSAA